MNLNRLRSKKTGITKEFALALAIAAALHLSLLFLFRIDLGQFFAPSDQQISMVVLRDSTEPSTSLLFDSNTHTIIPNYLVLKKPHSPSFFPSVTLKSDPGYTPIYLPDLEEMSVLPSGTICKGSLRFSQGRFIPLNEDVQLTSSKPCKAILAFRALTQSGQVFWLDWIESTQNKQLDREIEERLKKLPIRLANPSLHLMAASGIAEVEFAP